MTCKTLRTFAFVGLVLAAGCKPPANKPAAEAPSVTAVVTPGITDADWNLVQIGEQTNPLGAGGKPLTLRLDSALQRASGFGGCNRYSGTYTLRGDSLTFGAVMATKMACPDGMELETAWHNALPRVVLWAATESTLTLSAADGPVASFRKQ